MGNICARRHGPHGMAAAAAPATPAVAEVALAAPAAPATPATPDSDSDLDGESDDDYTFHRQWCRWLLHHGYMSLQMDGPKGKGKKGKGKGKGN